MNKLENLFAYFEVDEEIGKGYHAFVVQDKSGQRKTINFDLNNSDVELVKQIQDVVSDGVTRVDKATFEFSLQRSFMDKKNAVVLFQNDSPKNNLAGYRSISI